MIDCIELYHLSSRHIMIDLEMALNVNNNSCDDREIIKAIGRDLQGCSQDSHQQGCPCLQTSSRQQSYRNIIALPEPRSGLSCHQKIMGTRLVL
jgi:hypothetical protein